MLESEGFEEFLEKSEGAGLLKRKAAGAMSPSVTIEHDMAKETFKCTISVTLGTVVIDGVIGGPEFEYKDMEGSTIKSTLKWDGDTLVQAQVRDGKDDLETRRSFDEGGQLILTSYNATKDVRLTRKFKKKAAA